jgi:hypothetical protein
VLVCRVSGVEKLLICVMVRSITHALKIIFGEIIQGYWH